MASSTQSRAPLPNALARCQAGDIRTVQELLGHKDVETTHGLHPCVEPVPAEGSQPPGPAADAGLRRDPEDYAH